MRRFLLLLILALTGCSTWPAAPDFAPPDDCLDCPTAIPFPPDTMP